MLFSRLLSSLVALGLVAALIIPSSAVGQTVIYVDDDAGGANDGSQSDPYAALQEALSEAANTSGSVEIRVAGGTYYPDEGSSVTDGDNTASFELSGDLTVKGGYTGDFSGRDPAANMTVLSGDIDQDDATNSDGVVTDTADVSGTNSDHVVQASDISGTATLDGLTVTAGQANNDSDGTSNGKSGGGALLLNSDVVWKNAAFVGNVAFQDGGGIHLDDDFGTEPGSLAVENSSLRANAGQFGGAVQVRSGPLTLAGTTVQDNVANGGGGVHATSDKLPAITDVTFVDNKAIEVGSELTLNGEGGGLYAEGGDKLFGTPPDKTLVLRSVTFENNTTEYDGGGDPQDSEGGGAFLDVWEPTLIDLTFRGNTVSETNAGGLHLESRGGILRGGLFENNAASTPEGDATDASGGAMQYLVSGFETEGLTVANTTFRNNSAKTDGGAVTSSGRITFDSILFEENSAGANGGGLDISGSGWMLQDVVFRNNTSDGAGIGTVGGGGLAAEELNPDGVSGRLEKVRFESNESGADGGAMRVSGGTYKLKNVDFVDNVAVSNFGGQGAALITDDATVDLVNAEVRGNEGTGGMIEAIKEGKNQLTNVLLADNTEPFSVVGTGVVKNSGGSATLKNVVVASNGVTGLVNADGTSGPSSMTVHNSIVHQNEGQIFNDAEDGSTLNVQNTLVEGGLPSDVTDNGGNITGDPQFAAPSNGDYHLQSGSPAVDAGDDSLIPDDSLDLDADGDSSEAVPYDLDQNVRTEGTVDMGPYEAGSAPPQFTASLSAGDSDAGLPESFGAELTFQTLSTSTDLTVTYDGSASTEGLGLPGEQGLAVTALWNIEFSPEPSSSEVEATVCFDIGDLFFPVVDRSALNVYARSDPSGTDWQERTPTELRPSAENPEQICATEQSSFSQFAVTAKQSELPVELAKLEAHADAGTVVLSWKTTSETNNAGFEVQHRTSVDGAWAKMSFVDGAGTTNQSRSYRFSVEEGLAPGTHQFRLKQVDLDGTAHLSKAISVKLRMEQPVRLTAPSPNPVSGQTTVSFAVKETQETTIQLYNTLGQRVATVYDGTPQAGEQQAAQIDVSGLSSGVYFLRLTAGGETKTQRLTVVK